MYMGIDLVISPYCTLTPARQVKSVCSLLGAEMLLLISELVYSPAFLFRNTRPDSSTRTRYKVQRIRQQHEQMIGCSKAP